MQFLFAIVLAMTGALVVTDRVCDKPAKSDEAVQWLDKLEARGREVRSFQARVVHEKNDELLSDRTTRTGDITYAAAGENGEPPTRFAVVFRQLIADDKVHDQQLEYIFDGEWLVEKDHKEHRFEKRQVVAPGEKGKIDPLSVDGPFPLPLGQKRERVLQRFEVTVCPADAKSDPQGVESLHLRLVPRADAPAIRDQKKFDQVDFWFDRATLLPIKVVTDESSVTVSVKLSNVKINEADAAKLAELFDTKPPQGDWRVEIKPWSE